jgi:5-formyltetrahydrofolate cyclo-ligase
MLAYDDRLIRLGQGAGHYDRALSVLDQSIAIGLAWSVQFTFALASDIWDVPLDAVLTEKSWITL